MLNYDINHTTHRILGTKPLIVGDPIMQLSASVLVSAVMDLVTPEPIHTTNIKRTSFNVVHSYWQRGYDSSKHFFFSKEHSEDLHFWCAIAGVDPVRLINNLNTRREEIAELFKSRSGKKKQIKIITDVMEEENYDY